MYIYACIYGKNSRKYLCVRVKGQSMVPSILDGGYLIIRLMERSEWESIRDNYVYVVSDMEGRSYVKRLKIDCDNTVLSYVCLTM